MFWRIFVLATSLVVASASFAQSAKPFDAAEAFGARPSVAGLALSPDGTTVAYAGNNRIRIDSRRRHCTGH